MHGVAVRSRNRGSMLVQLIACLRQREQAEARLKQAQEELAAAESGVKAVLEQVHWCSNRRGSGC